MRRVIGVNTWVWQSPLDDEGLRDLAARAARLGFRAIELPVEQPGDWSTDAAEEALAEHRLAPIVIGAMGPGRNLVAAPGSEVVATQNYLVHCIGVAERIASAVVAGPFTAATGRTWRMDAEEREARYRELRNALAPVVRQAERAGVRLAIEPLNRYETSLVNTVEQALDALGPLLGPGLGLALDSYHLNIEEKDIGAAVRAAGPHLAHVQVCGNDRGAVGDDHFDWPAFLDALDDAGYAGVLGLESFTGENATIAVAASVWRPLAASQDDLAERSIRYLTALQDEREPRR
jgi:D-psicose/D-tagatose/L-ribulose 3-epimerase